jgi:hypothetical protein
MMLQELFFMLYLIFFFSFVIGFLIVIYYLNFFFFICVFYSHLNILFFLILCECQTKSSLHILFNPIIYFRSHRHDTSMIYGCNLRLSPPIFRCNLKLSAVEFELCEIYGELIYLFFF